VVPASEQTIELKIDDQARFIGVAGAFEQFDQARWKADVEIRDEALKDKLLLRANELNIELDALGVALRFE
jgi:type VI secretion system VasD/TssJ family lipoprotein